MNILAIAFLVLLSVPVAAQPPAGAPEPEVPTTIRALKLTYQQQANEAVFEGQVQVQRPDLQVFADRMVVTFKPAASEAPDAAAPGNPRIEKIVATGKVRILRAGHVGTGGKATFVADQELVILEDNPVVVNEADRSTLRGEVLRMYLRDNRSEAVGSGKSPVEMFFTTRPDKKGSTGGPQP